MVDLLDKAYLELLQIVLPRLRVQRAHLQKNGSQKVRGYKIATMIVNDADCLFISIEI